MMELASTFPFSKWCRWTELHSPLLAALTLGAAVDRGTVFDLNKAFNLFITAYPPLSIIFNANNFQVKSPLRGTLWRLTAWLFHYSGLYTVDLCPVLWRQVLAIFESRNLYLNLLFCKNQCLRACLWFHSQRKGLESWKPLGSADIQVGESLERLFLLIMQ